MISVIVFYSEKAEEAAVQEEILPNWYSSKKETKLSSRILQAQHDLLRVAGEPQLPKDLA